MFQETASSTDEEKRRPIKGLLTWLVLIPLILGTLICCGQLATLLMSGDKGVDTSSLLEANYHPWPYEKIPPINVEAFMRDIQEETRTVFDDDHWVFPTVFPVAQISETPNATRTNTPVTSNITTPTPTRFVTITPTVPTSTKAATSTVLPTITATNTAAPSSTATRTPPPIPPAPTSTNRPPDPQPTRTLTLIATTVVPTTAVPTTAVPTTAVPTTAVPTTPVSTTEVPPLITPTFTPTYAPVRPITENDVDQMENGGCRAYFGYRNDNPVEVDIEVGTLNNLNDQAAIDNPPQPTHFMVGRVFGAFEFTWYSGLTLIWTLDGRTATADWCYPP